MFPQQRLTAGTIAAAPQSSRGRSTGVSMPGPAVQRVRRGTRRIASSLLLQKVIYFNIIWSTTWWLVVILALLNFYLKGLSMSDPDVIRTVFIILFMAFEPFRLLAGYWGNLREQVPYLGVFVLLTIVPLLASNLYLLSAQDPIHPFQRALQIPQFAFLIAGLVLGCSTMRAMLKVVREQRPFMALEDESKEKTLQRPLAQMLSSNVSDGHRIGAIYTDTVPLVSPQSGATHFGTN